ncbi:MAG: nuclear transport factor 2 family protein [Deltaproteobacteria bacterium]|nr:nuclear transport factor 2 family protein [Deltaproteobacteria bacterium]
MSDANRDLGNAWLAAFNARDLDRLVGLYAEDAHHTSPKLRVQRPETGGRIVGQAALRAWWGDAFTRLPGMRYEPLTVTADAARVFLEYDRHVPGEPSYPVAEVFDVVDGRIVASRVYHG